MLSALLRFRLVVLLLALFAWTACESTPTRVPDDAGGTGFESVDPRTRDGTGGVVGTGGFWGTGGLTSTGGGLGTGGLISTGTGGASTGGSSTGGTDGGTRAVEEADLFKIQGNLLYAFSTVHGLSIVDISKPAELKIRGELKTGGTPFELYVRGNVVLGLVRELFTGGEQPPPLNRVLSIDVANPAAPRILNQFQVPGLIADSRLVGDVLYVVSYETANRKQVSVTSLNVANPMQVTKVDTRSVPTWSVESPSVYLAESRLYIAAPRNQSAADEMSTVLTLDISNAAGLIGEGTEFLVKGRVTNRWQLDEYQGTLRVLAQPWSWRQDPPVLQTFRVESTRQIIPLASLKLKLPRPEELRSVRFDGDRGYAITFQQTDPLFVLDLHNPAEPAQVAELEIPGWVYFMVPRGDRVFGVGYEGNQLQVSLFDVSQLSAPKLLDRVHFGAPGARVTEDQNRIQKAFTIIDELGLILVPISGELKACSMGSSLQLIDFTRDSLTLRGNVEGGVIRRAFVHEQVLFTVSVRSLASYGLSSRDSPPLLSRAEFSVGPIDRVFAVGNNHAARLVSESDDLIPHLEITETERIGEHSPLGTLKLASAGCAGGVTLFQVGPTLLALNADRGLSRIDTSDPKNPRMSAAVTLTQELFGGSPDGPRLAPRRISHNGRLFVAEQSRELGSRELAIIDVASASGPEITATVEAPTGVGYGPALIQGPLLLTSHRIPSGAGRVRFYLDAFDLSDPRHPLALDSVNIPGTLLGLSPNPEQLLTLDYELAETLSTEADCARIPGAKYNRNTGVCLSTIEVIKLVEWRDKQVRVLDRLPTESLQHRVLENYAVDGGFFSVISDGRAKQAGFLYISSVAKLSWTKVENTLSEVRALRGSRVAFLGLFGLVVADALAPTNPEVISEQAIEWYYDLAFVDHALLGLSNGKVRRIPLRD